MDFATYTFSAPEFDPLKVSMALAPSGIGFLDSPGEPGKLNRYSIVPLRSTEAYRLDDRGLVRIKQDKETPLSGDPFMILGAILEQRRLPASPEARTFPGGFFGYLSYDMAQHIERLPRLAWRDRPVPHLWLEWVDLVACYDHSEQKVILTSLSPDENLAPFAAKIQQALTAPLPPRSSAEISTPRPMISKETFMGMVAQAREYIAAGDVYQTNLSCRFDGRFSGSAEELYRRLRKVNPSPFACLLRSPGLEIVSSSPERLVSLFGNVAETRPIAGTRPRGYTPPEDDQLGQELLDHPKERAEHIMLLDLERNDLGKVCHSGTVQVDELMVLERYSHVTHIVSNVRGELAKGKKPFDLVRAMFPGGTITGVPKKRCMEIIEELEPIGRGTYTGSAGYISVTGDMDLNILIRTFQKFGNDITFQVGAGIVADSAPEKEWNECLAKGHALHQALEDGP